MGVGQFWGQSSLALSSREKYVIAYSYIKNVLHLPMLLYLLQLPVEVPLLPRVGGEEDGGQVGLTGDPHNRWLGPLMHKHKSSFLV